MISEKNIAPRRILGVGRSIIAWILLLLLHPVWHPAGGVHHIIPASLLIYFQLNQMSDEQMSVQHKPKNGRGSNLIWAYRFFHVSIEGCVRCPSIFPLQCDLNELYLDWDTKTPPLKCQIKIKKRYIDSVGCTVKPSDMESLWSLWPGSNTMPSWARGRQWKASIDSHTPSLWVKSVVYPWS
jgi:hypothetical protein